MKSIRHSFCLTISHNSTTDESRDGIIDIYSSNLCYVIDKCLKRISYNYTELVTIIQTHYTYNRCHTYSCDI